jgi:hypothetical protein
MTLKKMLKYKSLLLILLTTFAVSFKVSASDQTANGDTAKGLQQRIDFGSAYIMGQSIKSGAVYLMHRKQSDIESMINVRINYRNEIMEDYNLEKSKMVSEEGNSVEESKIDVVK